MAAATTQMRPAGTRPLRGSWVVHGDGRRRPPLQPALPAEAICVQLVGEDHPDHSKPELESLPLIPGDRALADACLVIDGDLNHWNIEDASEKHHLGSEIVVIDREERLHEFQGGPLDQPHGAPDVTERHGIEEHLHHLGHRVVTPFEELAHVGALPDEFLDRPRAKHEVEVTCVGEQLDDVIRVECPIWLANDDVVAGHLLEPASDGGAIALPRLMDLARRGGGNLARGAGSGIVVDDDDLVHITGRLELIDARLDRIFFVVGRKDDRYGLALPHRYFLTTNTLCEAKVRVSGHASNLRSMAIAAPSARRGVKSGTNPRRQCSTRLTSWRARSFNISP